MLLKTKKYDDSYTEEQWRRSWNWLCGLFAAIALLSSSGGPVPTELTALTRNTYMTPWSSPLTVADVVLALTVAAGCQDMRSASRFSMTYCVTSLPPVSLGGDHARLTLLSTALVTCTSRGGPGLSTPTVNTQCFNCRERGFRSSTPFENYPLTNTLPKTH